MEEIIDKEDVAYTVKEIKKHKTLPYMMANESRADAMYPFIRQEFPEVQYVKCGIFQYFIISARNRKKFLQEMQKQIAEKQEELKQLEQAVREVQQ